jgi:uncharacterized membrane protein
MQFIKTTILGGVIFLIPFVIVIAVLGKAHSIMLLVADLLSNWIPIDEIGGVALANLLALAAIVVSCFLFGLMARSVPAKKVYKTLDATLASVPGYAFVKGFADSISRSEEHAKSFIPVIARFDDSAQISFEIERTPEGNVVVYLPGAPNPWSGTVVFLEPSRVQKLDMSVADAIKSIQALGRGSAKFGGSENS